MTILSSKRNFKADLAKVKALSLKIEKRLHDSDSKIDSLTTDQLQDLNEILRLADYILTKYEDKKDFHDILKEFVDMINSSAASITEIDGDIDEMVLSAEHSISQIKDAQSKMAKNVDFNASKTHKNDQT